jgi:hypothetical protein
MQHFFSRSTKDLRPTVDQCFITDQAVAIKSTNFGPGVLLFGATVGPDGTGPVACARCLVPLGEVSGLVAAEAASGHEVEGALVSLYRHTVRTRNACLSGVQGNKGLASFACQ